MSTALRDRLLAILDDPIPCPELTDRERPVLRLAALGKSVTQISALTGHPTRTSYRILASAVGKVSAHYRIPITIGALPWMLIDRLLAELERP